jgi:hypothetical protein
MKKWVALSCLAFILTACGYNPPSENLSGLAGSWQPMGDKLNYPAHPNEEAAYIKSSSMVLKSNNNPMVAWEGDKSFRLNNQIYLSEWSGSSWVFFPKILNRDINNHATSPSLDLQSNDLPIVAWIENSAGLNGSPHVFVRRWIGTDWIDMGGALNVYQDSFISGLSLAVDTTGITPTNYPTVAWKEWDGISWNIYVKRWTGNRWVRLGGVLDIQRNRDVGAPSLALSKSGQPVVAWSEATGTRWEIYVKFWNGSSWLSYGIGESLNKSRDKDAFSPSLALDNHDYPVVAWQEAGIMVKRWNGSKWGSVGNDKPIATYPNLPTNPNLKLNAANQPVVAWDFRDGFIQRVDVKYWDKFTRSWVRFDVDHGAQPGMSPHLVLHNGNLPIVAFQTEFDLYVKKWVP